MADPEPVQTADTSASPAAEPSLAEHEAQFGKESTRRPEPDREPESDKDPPRPDRSRDETTGQFVKPTRHRAKSQEASPADVPRIAELTRRLRETEAERDALKTRANAPPPAAPEPRVEPAAQLTPAEPPKKPTIDQFTTHEDWMEALADWKIADARRVDREERQRESAETAERAFWNTRVEAAKARHDDYEQVALVPDIHWREGSLTDHWIREHRFGAELLYTLQRDPQEAQRIQTLAPLDQVEALALLTQRSGSTTREPAVTTGAAATPTHKVAPRPPTPVRTSVVAAPDEPPSEDASLAEHEAYYGQRRTRR